MFESYIEKFYISNIAYLDKPITGIGSISNIYYKKYSLPYTTSARSHSLNTLIAKMYSEYTERIGFGCFSFFEKQVDSINIRNLKTKSIDANKLGLNGKATFGYVDTTGTAANNKKSNDIVRKAICELIEKNELYLFWYLHYGKRIKITPAVTYILKNQGMLDFENYLFVAQNLSLMPTVIYIGIKNGHIVSTGISCDLYFYSAIKKAVAEAKIMYMFNLRRNRKCMDISELEHKKIYKFIRESSFSSKYLQAKKILNYVYFKLKLSSDVGDIYVSLNSCMDERTAPKLITAFSDSLIKCVPTKENIRLSHTAPFLCKYNCKKIDEHLDCIVV